MLKAAKWLKLLDLDLVRKTYPSAWIETRHRRWRPGWYALTTAQVRFAHETGALVHLQFVLNYLTSAQIAMGALAAAARLMEENHLIAEATGNPARRLGGDDDRHLAWPGDRGTRLIEAVSQNHRRAAGQPYLRSPDTTTGRSGLGRDPC